MVSTKENIKVGMQDYTLRQAMTDIASLRSQIAGFQSVDGNPPHKATVDTNSFTVTSASATALSQTFAIDGGDPQAGTTYRLTAWGNGTWGSTAQAMGWWIGFPDLTEFGTHQAWGAALLAASAVFRWNAVINLMCLSPGASASWHGTLAMVISETANSITNASAAFNSTAGAQGPSSNVTQDSTVSNNLCLAVNWGSTTGAPTITCHASILERIGP